MKLGHELRLEGALGSDLRLELCGGGTDSLFPQVERVLLSDPDAQAALFYVSGSKKIENYESLMDFMFCETFPEHRSKCLKYYAGDGPPLRETLADVPEWKFYNDVMLAAIGFAKTAYRRRQRVHWTWFVGTLKKAVRAGA